MIHENKRTCLTKLPYSLFDAAGPFRSRSTINYVAEGPLSLGPGFEIRAGWRFDLLKECQEQNTKRSIRCFLAKSKIWLRALMELRDPWIVSLGCYIRVPDTTTPLSKMRQTRGAGATKRAVLTVTQDQIYRTQESQSSWDCFEISVTRFLEQGQSSDHEFWSKQCALEENENDHDMHERSCCVIQ